MTALWVVCGLAVGFYLLTRSAARQKANVGALLPWQRFGHKRKLQFRPPGMLIEQRSPVLSGFVDGVELHIDLTDAEAGEPPDVRIVARGPKPIDGVLHVHKRGHEEPAGAALGEGRHVRPTGDSAFDGEFVVVTSEDAHLRLLDDEARGALLALQTPLVRLACAQGTVTILLRGGSDDEQLLEDGVAAALALSRLKLRAGYR